MANCNFENDMIEQFKKLYPDVTNISPPKEFTSKRLYLEFTGEKIVRGKPKTINLPVLLSKCPFCGTPY